MPWCPEPVRNSLTEFLSCIWKSGCYAMAEDKMTEILQKCNKDLVVDLCSGCGTYMEGFIKNINEKMPGKTIRAYKTDLYPDSNQIGRDTPFVSYWPESVSMQSAFSRFDALFTMFSALHHFDEDELEEIFESAASKKVVFSFFDISQRRWLTDILPNIFLPFVMWCVSIFIKPFSWKRLFWVYIIPIAPVVVLIDGTISRMRAYKLEEVKNIYKKVEDKFPDYCFEAEYFSILGGLQKITWIVGMPRKTKEKEVQDH